jgi:hypothetical protein
MTMQSPHTFQYPKVTPVAAPAPKPADGTPTEPRPQR